MELNLFKLPVYAYFPDEWESKQNILIGWSKETNFERINIGGFYSSKTDRDFSREATDLFADEIQNFAKETGYKEIEMSSAFFSKYPQGSHQIPHVHPNCNWTAVVFVKNTINDPLYFESPYPNPYNGWTDHIPTPRAEEGCFYIFPSWLVHHVMPTKSLEDRLVFTFDLHTK